MLEYPFQFIQRFWQRLRHCYLRRWLGGQPVFVGNSTYSLPFGYLREDDAILSSFAVTHQYGVTSASFQNDREVVRVAGVELDFSVSNATAIDKKSC